MKRIITVLSLICHFIYAQESPKEEDFYKIVTPPVPEGVLLEVGGLCMLPNGNLGLATRRGEIFIIENPNSRIPYFRKFASGLHEILGLEYKDGAFICAQRGELSKISDTDGDGKADHFETIHAWAISGHYHEYSFGPKTNSEGDFFVSGNVAFGVQEWWRGESNTPTRGTIFKIKKNGEREAWAAGVRSPAGLGYIDGDLFYTDNQGDWMGSGGVWHVKKGAFMGHPASLKWIDSNSPVKLSEKDFFEERDNRKIKGPAGNFIKPENIINEKTRTLAELKVKYPAVQSPAVWLPHGILGVSNSEIIKEDSKGAFGPFSGQILVGDQGQSKIMRVQLEKIKGEYQGAAWDFRSGFQSGVMRLVQAPDGSIYVGETNRGWGSAGDANQGLQRLVWNSKLAFEMLSCSATPDGFEIKFTMPVDKNSLGQAGSIKGKSFIYKHHPVYGSPPVEEQILKIKAYSISNDAKTLRLVVDNLRKTFIHELDLDGIRSADKSWSLLHPKVYYTLNEIPEGEKLKSDQIISLKPALGSKKSETKENDLKSPDGNIASNKVKVKTEEKGLGFAELKPLLQKYTCLACHAEDKKVIGPSFKEIAKRNYSPERIVQLIYKPEPQNWPTYATPMAAMPQVPKSDALKIGRYINGLTKK
jgi:cytochrome c551/c552